MLRPSMRFIAAIAAIAVGFTATPAGAASAPTLAEAAQFFLGGPAAKFLPTGYFSDSDEGRAWSMRSI